MIYVIYIYRYFSFVFLRYPIIDFCYALQRNVCRRAAFFRQKCFLLKRIVVHFGIFSLYVMSILNCQK